MKTRTIPLVALTFIPCVAFAQLPLTTRPIEVPSEYVAIAGGYYVHPSCITEVHPGEIVLSDGSIQEAGGAVRSVPSCPYPAYDRRGKKAGRGSTPTVNGWVADAKQLAHSGDGFDHIEATWQVPQLPDSWSNQILYFFPALVDARDVSILQPVLGLNQDGTAGFRWTIRPWFIYYDAFGQQHVYTGADVQVYPGDTIYGFVNGSNCNSTTNVCQYWDVQLSDLSLGGSGTGLLISPTWTFPVAYGAAFEAYQLTACEQLPLVTAQVAFNPITLHEITHGTQSLAWAAENPNPTCSSSVSPAGSYVSIQWCVPLSRLAACGDHCGQTVSDRCGGSYTCAAPHSCPLHYLWDSGCCCCTQ